MQFILANLKKMFGINTIIKLYLFQLMNRYNILLDYQTSYMMINFKNNFLNYKGKNFKLKFH